jgi:hypothetical protein
MTEKEVELLLSYALTWGWEEFMIHVGHLLTTQAINTSGDQRDALQAVSEVVHARLALWRQCGDGATPDAGSTPRK